MLWLLVFMPADVALAKWRRTHSCSAAEMRVSRSWSSRSPVTHSYWSLGCTTNCKPPWVYALDY